MRLDLAIAAVTAAVLASSAAMAHQVIIVVGQVISISPKVLVISSPDGKPIVVNLTPAVKVREGQTIKKMKDVKVARRVSVQGYGHTYDDMFVRSITLLPKTGVEESTPMPGPPSGRRRPLP
jgi:hypothetical protein